VHGIYRTQRELLDEPMHVPLERYRQAAAAHAASLAARTDHHDVPVSTADFPTAASGEPHQAAFAIRYSSVFQ
jgi:hypothetical protein